jgi:hypothetical protein
MSLVTRNFFDKIQNSTFTKLRLPSPPYYDPSYWDRAYKDSTPDDCIEWGGFDLTGLLNFRYEHVPIEEGGVEKDGGMSTIAQWLNIRQHSSPEEASSAYQERRRSNDTENDAILLLGCGNSKMGEQLLVNSFQGPFLQVDVSSKIIQCMTQRYEKYLKEALVQRMEFIVDDAATGLTSLEPQSIGGAVIDKGLFDALHCSLPNINERTDKECPMQSILKSVHTVLQPSRPFVFFSRSSPEFMLRRTFGDDFETAERRRQWSDISVIKLIDLNVMLYRFIKAEENEEGGINNSGSLRVTTRAFRKKNRQQRR